MSLSRPAALLAALLLTTLGALTLSAAPASAHASLIGANPEDGATVQRPPTEVSLEFSEEVSEPAFVSVTTADGLDVTGGRVTVEGATVTRPLAAAAAAGEYTVAYRVVSVDGHPIEGETTFTASQPAAAPKASTQPDEGATGPSPTDEASASDEPTTADSGSDAAPAASQTDESEEGGVSTTVLIVGAVVLVAVVTLLMLARRRGNQSR